ncbi:ETX/MTX2 family pore-forming toxin [Carnobacterium maltaromaticum]|uniref:ETX/MTX2 family pore-forming toxin n=1 Tax=Carnobacterium maltaromaticum TaxID=2751 RepID=UPI0039B0C924
MKKSKVVICGIILLSSLSTLGVNRTANADVNANEFKTLTRQWTDACYLLGTGYVGKVVGSENPNRLFNSPEEAYAQLSSYAYSDPILLTTHQGFSATGQSITLDGEPLITESTEVVSGSETLTNNTSGLLNMQSNSTQLTTTNAVTVTTTSSYNLGVTDKVSFEIPAVLKDELSLSFTYNLSNSKAQTTTTSESITLPSQVIPVKSGHSVEVNYVMKVSKGTGNLNINGELSGTSVGYLTWSAPDQEFIPSKWMGLGEMLDYFGYPVANGFTKVSNNTVSHKGGSAQYTSTSYTDIQLQVKDLTDSTKTLYKLDNSNFITK